MPGYKQELATYTGLLEDYKAAYLRLQALRKDIQAFDARIVKELTKTGATKESVTVRSQQGVVRLLQRNRRVPLTQETLAIGISKNLKERLKDKLDDPSTLDDLGKSIAQSIWHARAIKHNTRVSLRLG